ncbi:AlkA N-terminal domain-containing protein [soil metagenome]
MNIDHQRCYRAVEARDARFDGVFFTGVRTTGIYCRPSCSAVTPKAINVAFYATAAAAHEAGFRACRRCRPDSSPGSPEWNVRADAVGRAMQMIADGVVERDGVDGLAERLGYSTRHVTRMLTDELGAGPLAIARSGRAHTARLLIETTSMSMTDVAFAAGFASVRQFNDTVRQVYATTPSAMRGSRGGAPGGRIAVRLAVRQPFYREGLMAFLGGRAISGVEVVDGFSYVRVVNLPRGPGVVALTLHADHVACTLELTDLADTAVAVQRCRRLLDLDADPVAIGEVLSADPVLAPMVAEAPGIRLPSQVSGFEVAVRAIVGQQISVAGARTVLGRIVAAYGTPVALELAREHGLTHAFPTADQLSDADSTTLSMPAARGRAIVGLAQAVADGKLDLDPGADRAGLRERLVALPGIGPWTAGYVAMRALSDPDEMLETDLIIRRMLTQLGIDATRTDRWRPWRSYAAMYLWRQSQLQDIRQKETP